MTAGSDDEHPYAALTPDLGVVVGRGEAGLLAISPQQAIDLGTALVALGKRAALLEAASWPRPEEQRTLISVVFDDGVETQVNFAGLVELASAREGDWRFAWELALDTVDTDHGSTQTTGWRLTVGRSRRLELALQMRSWLEANPELKPVLERDLGYLASKELEDRLLSL